MDARCDIGRHTRKHSSRCSTWWLGPDIYLGVARNTIRICLALVIAVADHVVAEMAAEPSSSTGQSTADILAAQPEDARQAAMSGPLNVRGDRRPPPMQRAFSRQVSLGSGVTVMGMDRGRNGGGRGQRSLPRSGRSLGVLNHSGPLAPASADGAARRADFRMFRTKSTLSRQNSLLPSRIRESDVELLTTHVEEQPAGAPAEDPLNKSVPAGRYFAALQGPELDEVRVCSLFFLGSHDTTCTDSTRRASTSLLGSDDN
jgi:hypothetical protein